VRSSLRWAPPYLVLLRAGFCLPPVLPRARCALTAPFHPYLPSRFALRWASPASPFEAPTRFTHRSAKHEGGRYVFCATFLQVTLTGRYPAHCPAEFGLSSPPCGEAVAWLAATGSIVHLVI